MEKKSGLILGSAVFAVLTIATLAFSQEAVLQENATAVQAVAAPAQQAPAAPVEAETPAVPEQEMQWVWGEVTTAGYDAGELTVKYFDYDVEQDKEIMLLTDQDTLYENVSSLSGVKAGDNVSIDYIIAGDPRKPRNLAKNITLEPKEEEAPIDNEVALPDEEDNAIMQAPQDEADKEAEAPVQ